MKVMLVVTGLMGAGHLTRILLIAKALKAAGAMPLIVNGGREIPHLDTGGVDLENLAPVWSDGVDYSRILTPEGLATPEWFEKRATQLCAIFDRIAPDALITELFPFGRRALATEFEALLTHARGRARIYASIRDVLEPKRKPKRAEETAARLRAFYDGVLFHGDPALIPLVSTWPLADDFSDMIHPTGYVASPPPPALESGAGEVLVSVGGGVIGRPMLEMAIEAARLSPRLWRLRVGGADADLEIARLKSLAGESATIIEAAAPDHRARLGSAACSVSLLGYNTATDLLQAGTPAIILPMQEAAEKEQIIRAEAFAKLPGFHMPEPGHEALADMVEKAAALPGPPADLVDLTGAETSARVIMDT